MGIWPFSKKSGKKVIEEEQAQARAAAERRAIELRESQENALEQVIVASGLPIDNLSVELVDDQAIVYGDAPSQSDAEKAILALGNIEGISCVDDRINVVTPEPVSTFYEVQSGDTLGKIAKAHYGDAMKYPVIFEANKPLLSDPDKIYPGQMLRIPPL